MNRNLATKLHELLARYSRSVWPDVILMEHTSSSIGKSCSVQTIQLLTVQVRINSLVVGEWLIVDDFLPTYIKTFLIIPHLLKIDFDVGAHKPVSVGLASNAS